ncbi:MAG: hypothetical protein WCH83_04300 [Alphaproteobacteria bacterium]|jgi:hypothetical protein
MDMIAFAALSRHIRPDERLLWCGRPDPLAFAASRAGLVGVIGAAIVVATLVAEVVGCNLAARQITTISPWLVIALGLPTLILGAGLLIEPVRAYRNARATVYGLTSRRAIVLQTRPRKSLRTIQRNAIQAIMCRPASRDTADVTFSHRAGGFGVAQAGVDGFHAIKDASLVEKLAAQPVDAEAL